MRGQVVVLDSSDLNAVIADATGEAPADPKAAPEVKVETQPRADDGTFAPKVEAVKGDDETEDENGLTEADKKILTDKMQRAIGKKHRALKEAEEFGALQYSEKRLAEETAERLEREIARLKAQTAAPVQEAKPDAAPKRETFGTDEEYQSALIDFKVDQRLKAEKAEDAKRRETERQEEIKRDAGARITAAVELVPDFKEKMDALGDDDRIPDAVASYMQESSLIAEIGYYLATHKDELAKIQQMKPITALVAIGKIEAKLEPFGKKATPEAESKKNGATPNAEKPTATAPSPEVKPKAAAPVFAPLNTGSASQVEKPFQSMTYAEARADFEKKNGVKFNRRERH